MTTAPAATGPLLWGRAVVLSAVALATGAFAHVQADGLLPGLVTLVVLVATGALVCAPFLRSEGSTLRIVVLLVAGQSVVHTALAFTAGHRGDPTSAAASPTTSTPAVPAGSGDRAGSYYDVAYAAQTGGHGGGLSLPAPLLHAFTDITSHPGMAVAHLLAAAVCGWWLASGERALWRLVDLTSRGWSELAAPALLRWVLATRALVLSALGVQVPGLVVAVLEPRPQSAVRSRSVSRRGPPLAA